MYRRSNLLEKLCPNPLASWQRYIDRETRVRRYSARPMQLLQVFRLTDRHPHNNHQKHPLGILTSPFSIHTRNLETSLVSDRE